MSSEETDLVRRLQAFADGLREKPLPLLLANDPGPYQLPRCRSASVHILDSDTAQLILDTENDQRILVPMSADLLESLGRTISSVFIAPQDDPK
jgi:hypothetical protein